MLTDVRMSVSQLFYYLTGLSRSVSQRGRAALYRLALDYPFEFTSLRLAVSSSLGSMVDGYSSCSFQLLKFSGRFGGCLRNIKVVRRVAAPF